MARDTEGTGPNGANVVRGRRSGRRPGTNQTRDDILRAARKLFAENGYGGATMRTIAREANVDAALIHHFFVSKEGVFAAAIEESFELTGLVVGVLEGGDEAIGERLVRGFLGLWSAPETRNPMLAVIRSALSYEGAARLLRDFVSEQVIAHVVKASTQEEAQLRGTLVGSQLVGMAIMRHVVKVEPLASADVETIVRFLGPTIDRYLTDDFATLAPPQDPAPEIGPTA
jgi:AcrR family transcriptional regulator